MLETFPTHPPGDGRVFVQYMIDGAGEDAPGVGWEIASGSGRGSGRGGGG